VLGGVSELPAKYKVQLSTASGDGTMTSRACHMDPVPFRMLAEVHLSPAGDPAGSIRLSA